VGSCDRLGAILRFDSNARVFARSIFPLSADVRACGLQNCGLPDWQSANFHFYWDFLSMRSNAQSRFASLQGDLKVLEMHGNVILKFLDQRIRTACGFDLRVEHGPGMHQFVRHTTADLMIGFIASV
jgi:hypothetical protein